MINTKTKITDLQKPHLEINEEAIKETNMQAQLETNQEAIKEAQPEVKKLTKEELKAKFRESKVTYSGRLFIDDKYKKPDKVLRIDNDDAATRNYLSQLGYTPVYENVPVGSGSCQESHGMGSEVHIEQGVTSSQPGILYEIDKDLYEARLEVEAEKNDRQLQSVIETNESPSAHDKRMREMYGHKS